jgi:hypothetical protein
MLNLIDKMCIASGWEILSKAEIDKNVVNIDTIIHYTGSEL